MDDQSPNEFMKAGANKARPSLIPVEFRRALREAEETRGAPDELEISDVYALVEQYEQGVTNGVEGMHILIQASQYLQDVVEEHAGLFLPGLARVFTMGARKYSPNNWMKCTYVDRFRYVDAFYRHAYAWQRGEDIDAESGDHHLFHAACCLAILHGIDIMQPLLAPPVKKPARKNGIITEEVLDNALAQSGVTAARDQRASQVLSTNPCRPIDLKGNDVG